MIPPIPLSWWVTCAFRDDREAFYVRASIEGERIRQTDKRASPYTTAIADRGDYWKKPKAVSYHDEAV